MKKPYSHPKVQSYGYVRQLTGGSIGNGMDGLGLSMAMMGMMGMMCDRRLKRNVRKIGEHELGFGLYLFDYKPEFASLCSGKNVLGVMADEVRDIMPEAVKRHSSGYLMVDHMRLGIMPQRLAA